MKDYPGYIKQGQKRVRGTESPQPATSRPTLPPPDSGIAYTCGHCGRVCGDSAGGYGSVNNVHLCHPNAHNRPDCYRLVTVYHRPLGELKSENLIPEPPDGTRLEFDHNTDIYGAFRDDHDAHDAGWTNEVWLLYGDSIPKTWRQMVETFGVDSLRSAVKLMPESISIRQALAIARNYAGIDGGHHKMWVIDQMVRVLTGDDYPAWVAETENGEDGPATYQWDTGITP